MNNVRIQSFTEKALLNRWVLNVFSPMDHEPMPLKSIDASVFKSVFHAQTNPFNNRGKNRTIFFKGAHLLVTTPIRVAFIGLTVGVVEKIRREVLLKIP